MTKKYKATEDQFRKALLKWLSNKADQLRANVHGDDDTSEWCKDEADLVAQHIQTVDSLIFVNEALKVSADEAHRQADLAYDRIEELEAKLAKAVEALQSMPEAVVHTTLDDGPLWPEDRTGVWLAALHACKNVVQSKVDQTLAELKEQDDE